MSSFGVSKFVNGDLCQSAQLAADRVGGETGAEQAAVERSGGPLVERAAQRFQSACQTRTHDCAFIGFGGALRKRGLDVTVGHTASPKIMPSS